MLKLFEKLGTLLGICTTKEQKTPTVLKQESSDQIQVIPTSIRNTPFGCVRRGNNDYVIVFGRNMITDKVFTSPEHAEVWANKQDWYTILNVVGIMLQEELKNYQKIN